MADNIKTLYDEAVSKAVETAKAMNENRTQKEIKDLKKATKSCVDRYNQAVTAKYYKDMAEKHGADALQKILEAEECRIPGVIAITFKEEKSGVVYHDERDAKIKANLVDIEETIGVAHFHSADWFKRLQVLARMMSLALNKDLGGAATFKYVINDACESFELGEDADPKSAASMVKAFQKVIDDVLWIGDAVNKKGEPVNGLKFTSKNWAYIRECMTRQGSEIGEVVIGSPMKAAELVADCIHLLLKNKGNRLKTAE